VVVAERDLVVPVELVGVAVTVCVVVGFGLWSEQAARARAHKANGRKRVRCWVMVGPPRAWRGKDGR
jgi:hypothetical protein